jgi:hypothetical protein
MRKKGKWLNSKWGVRRKIGKHDCGGTIWEYEAVGFLPKVKKCDRCGSDMDFM